MITNVKLIQYTKVASRNLSIQLNCIVRQKQKKTSLNCQIKNLKLVCMIRHGLN